MGAPSGHCCPYRRARKGRGQKWSTIGHICPRTPISRGCGQKWSLSRRLPGVTAATANIRSVTSDGSAYTRFRRALDTGNLPLVRAAAAELPHVDLADALE